LIKINFYEANPTAFNFRDTWKWMVSFRPWPLYPQCKMSLNTLKGVGESYQLSDTFLKKKYPLLPPRTQRFLNRLFLMLDTVPKELLGLVARKYDNFEGEIMAHTVLRSCKIKVKVSHNRTRWSKGFRVG